MARHRPLLLLALAVAGYACIAGAHGFVNQGLAAPQRQVTRRSLDKAFELPPEKVVEAVSRANSRRVTAADVAAAGGLSLSEAKSGVVALAAALGAETELEVSKTGEIVYNFPGNVQGALSKASTAAAAREAWGKAKPVVFTVLRAAFGVALFASIAVIYSAIIAISSSSNRDRDDRRSDSFGGGFGGGFGGPGLYYGPSPFDLFYYRPYYDYGGPSGYDSGPPKMGFLESVYSFVFGDGDPNVGREERQLSTVAEAARRHGGVLTAEQMAPLLDPPEYTAEGSSYNVNESWVLPAISKLNGRPEVAKNGEIVYVFDDLQTTAASTAMRKPAAILEEKEIPFSKADDGNLALVALLGVANLVGAAYLGAQFAGLGAVKLVGFLGTVKTLYPALLTYAVGFFAAPAWRWFSGQKLNQEIQKRNQNRKQWLNILQSGEVEGKLAEARKFRQNMREISAGDSVYSTAKDADTQGAKSDLEDFDRRLRG